MVLRRMKNIKLLKFYYSGILDGLMGKKGLVNKSFEYSENLIILS